MDKKKLKDNFYSFAIFFETYILPLLYFYYAYINSAKFAANFSRFYAVSELVLLGQANSLQVRFFSRMAAIGLLIPYNLLVVSSLLLRKNLHRKCDRPVEVIVPLLSILFASAYNFSDRLFPQQLNFFLVPTQLLPLFAAAGSVLVIAGIGIDLIALANLWRSFALFVEVRDVVTRGLYRYVRHPMYLSHVIKFTGICLAACTVANICITAISLALFVWRALLEEEKIRGAFPHYRRYMEETPFLFPRIRGRRPDFAGRTS